MASSLPGQSTFQVEQARRWPLGGFLNLHFCSKVHSGPHPTRERTCIASPLAPSPDFCLKLPSNATSAFSPGSRHASHSFLNLHFCSNGHPAPVIAHWQAHGHDFPVTHWSWCLPAPHVTGCTGLHALPVAGILTDPDLTEKWKNGHFRCTSTWPFAQTGVQRHFCLFARWQARLSQFSQPSFLAKWPSCPSDISLGDTQFRLPMQTGSTGLHDTSSRLTKPDQTPPSPPPRAGRPAGK